MGGHGSGKKQCERFVKGCNWLQKQVCVASMVMLNSLKLCWDSRAFISRQRRDVSAILFVTCSQREREREGEREGDIYRSLSYSSCNQSLPFACIGQLGIICAKMSFLERKALQTDTI